MKGRGFWIVTGFIFFYYKPQQITITLNRFFNSNGSSLGQFLQQHLLSTGSSLNIILDQLATLNNFVWTIK
jgi:hypothetical protein